MVRTAPFMLMLCVAGQAAATDLTSSETGYRLTPGGNPFVVVPDAIIDTRAAGGTAIDSIGSPNSTWSLTNNGSVEGGFWAAQFFQRATVVNNGLFFSPTNTALALFGGADVTNAAGGVIAGKLDGIFAGGSGSTVVNAGDIAGDIRGLAIGQAGIHLPNGGTVTNLATGRIAGIETGILAAPATTVINDGLIASESKAAIDLTGGTSSTGGLVVNSGTIIGKGGTAILFGPNDDTLRLAGTSAITGVVDGGAHTAGGANTLILGGTVAGSFDVSAIGDGAQYRNFNVLRKEDASVWTLTGANSTIESWQMAGGSLIVAGQLNGSITAAPQATGLDIEVMSGGAVHAPDGSAISLGPASRLTNRGSISGNGDTAATVDVHGAGSSIDNAGSIAAAGANAPAVIIDASGGSASLANKPGAAIGSAQGIAVLGGANVVVMNAGTLTGRDAAVRFTGANDVLILDTGSIVNGDLDGGGGAGNALVLQGAGSLASRTIGFATLAARGTDWVLAGTTTVNAATIEAGTLRVNGTLTSASTTVAPGAALAGTGTLVGPLVTQGTIAPGDAVVASAGPAARALLPLAVGTLHVAGSYAQTAGSRYEVDVLPTGNDLVDITGAATLQGGTVQARLRAASFRRSDTYTIVTASDGLTGAFAGVTTLNPFVQPSLAYDANHAYLIVQRGFQQAGGTPNEVAVEAALDHGIAGIGANAPPSRDFLTVIVDLLNLEGQAAYAGLDQLGAEAYAGLLNAHIMAARQTMGGIHARLADARGGACPMTESKPQDAATADPRFCSWATVLGTTGHVGGYDTWLTQHVNLAGAAIGIDYRAANAVTVGATMAYMHGNTSTDTLPAHGQFDSVQVALYGSYVPGRYWLQGALGYARSDDQMRRDIPFTTPPRTAQGKPDGNQYFMTLRTGIDLTSGPAGVLSPFAGFDTQRVDLSGFTETGADSINLAVQSPSASATRSLLGVQWRHAPNWFGSTWHVNASVAWAHEYGSLTRTINARFVGAPNSDFAVHGSGIARDAAQLGLGVNIAVGRSTHMFIRYDGEFGGRTTMHAGSAGIAYHW